MVAVCHSVVRAPAARVTRLNSCCEVVSTGCDYATTESFVDITLTKVMQERQDAFQLNANGDSCVDKPKFPFLRWYEVVVTFCNVDPELFNIVSNEPLILNDAVVPQAVGWCTLPDSASAANFALDFWTGTDEDGCEAGEVDYGLGTLACIKQGMIGDVTIANGVINFTVSGITQIPNAWGLGPYNVLINESGPNAGLPGLRLTAMDPRAHKCFFWTKLAPPPGACGCQDITPLVTVSPLAGVAPLNVTLTIPTGVDGNPLLPGVISWGDLSAAQVVTSGVSVPHTYTLAGNYTATYKSTAYSAPTYTSAVVVVT